MSKAKIQIVEDERIVAEDMRQCLEAAGYEVCGIAKSGALALELAEKHSPDIILMDIVIRGDIDGIDTAALIRERFGIPVIYLTAYSQEGVLERAKPTQPLAYLIKPFKESTLLSTLEMALHKSVFDAQIAESKEMFHTTLKSIGDGVISTDSEGRVVFLNQVAEQLTGWTHDEALSKPLAEVFEIINPESGEPVEIPSLKAMKEGTVCGLERGTVLIARDGRRIPVDDSGAPIHDEDGKLSGSVLIFRDVEGEVQREVELEDYRTKLETMVEHRTAQLERRIGLEGIISEISSDLILCQGSELEAGIRDAFEKIASFEDLGLVAFVPLEDGKCIVWPPEVETKFEAGLKRLARGLVDDPQYHLAPGTSVAIEKLEEVSAILEKEAGELGIQALFAAGLGNAEQAYEAMVLGSMVERAWNKEDRRILGMLGAIIHGVVERTRVETERVRLTEELQQSRKMEAIGKLSGGIAHDFNNMLVPIIGYSESILESGAPRAEEEMGAILKAAKSAADLTKQLLAFSRKQILRKRPVDLGESVANLRTMLERIIGEDVQLESEIVDAVWAVEADKGQIEQVILNLCVNARDAMPGGGAIQLKVENVNLEGGQDRSQGDFVRVSIADNGCGIPEDVLERMFEPFFSTKGQQGTGLGLSVVLGIIEQHGGWIDVDSRLGEGTCFKVYLPAHPEMVMEKEGGSAPVERSASGNRERILVVEDEPSVMAFVKQILAKNGYEVTAAVNVKSAVIALDEAAGDFDLLFTDAMLPDGTGLDVITKARELKHDMRILLSSGYSDDRSLLAQAQAEDIRFLPKPYSLDQLFSAVRDALSDGMLIS